VNNRYCGPKTPWGLPAMKDTPAPVDYVYTKANRPTTDEERQLISERYQKLET